MANLTKDDGTSLLLDDGSPALVLTDDLGPSDQSLLPLLFSDVEMFFAPVMAGGATPPRFVYSVFNM